VTDAEKQVIVRHLAEKVCGWTMRGECLYDGGRLVDDINTFQPLADANDTALVMAAWRKRGGELDITIAKRTIKARASMRSGAEYEATSDDSWTEPVCRVIADASGWEG
jgi:hypothetical protein